MIVLWAFTSVTAFAQDYPQYEFSGGFSYERAEGGNGMGWNASGVKNLNHYLGIAVTGIGLDWSKSQTSSGISAKDNFRHFAVLAGPQVKSRDENSKWEPHLHLLLGVDHSTESFDVAGSSSTDSNLFALTLGGGLDVRLKNKSPLALRLVQVDYMGLRSTASTAYGNMTAWRKGLVLSFGLVLNLGKASE